MKCPWPKEQNMISCYQLDDLGHPWQKFECLWWWKSVFRTSRNFWKVAQMKDLLIPSDHKKFWEIWLENTALESISSWSDDKGFSEFNGFPCRQHPAWGQDEDRRLKEVTPGCQPGQSSTCTLNSSPLFLLPYPPLLSGLSSSPPPPPYSDSPPPSPGERSPLEALLKWGAIPEIWWRLGKDEAVLLSLFK